MIHYARASDGCRLAWMQDGRPDAPTLLLCNSIGTDADLWAPQLSEFGRRFHVVRFDMRGHGRSEAPDGEYSLETLTSDALAVLDAAEVERSHICGLSLGGAPSLSGSLSTPRNASTA